jgi:hypothetical protein
MKVFANSLRATALAEGAACPAFGRDEKLLTKLTIYVNLEKKTYGVTSC